MRHAIRIAAVSLAMLLTVSCGDITLPTGLSEVRPVVYVDNYPLEYFAERIGAERIQVYFPARPGEDPAFWQPDAATIEAYQNADAILLNGATYAKWAERASLPPSKVVDTSAAFRDQLLTIPETVTHSHGPGGQHTHSGVAFTTWLDLNQALQQAEAVEQAIAGLLPETSAPQIHGNFARLRTDLQAMDTRMAAAATPWRDLPLLASHPVFQYFARRYGLDLVSKLWEPDQMPPEEEWTRLEQELKSRPAGWMIWEAQPSQEIASRLSLLRVASVVIDPCATRPARGDFLTVMESNIETLALLGR